MATPTKIKYGTFELLRGYLQPQQRKYAESEREAANPNWPCMWSMIHNDHEIRARFIINGRGEAVIVDMPIEAFNLLPTYTAPNDPLQDLRGGV